MQIAGRTLLIFACLATVTQAEVHSLTLQQALALAARQNPDVLLARLDALHAQAGVDVARDPFSIRFAARSDAVYTNGYPNNVNGHSPSLIAGQVDMALYDRPRRYQLAAAREQVTVYAETARGKQDEVAYRVASLFLDARKAEEAAELAARQVAAFTQIAGIVDNQLAEGRVLPVDAHRAQLDVTAARQRQQASELDEHLPEMLLATALGFSGNDRVHPAAAPAAIVLPELREDKAIDTALANNKDLLSLQAAALAKRIELQSYKKTRVPQVNLIAQYSLVQKSTYESYFPANAVQRNNGQIGADFILPVLVGSAPVGRLAQTRIDLDKLQLQIYELQNRISANTHRAYQQLKKATESLDLARDQADLAAGELSLESSRASEGHAGVADIDRAHLSRNTRETLIQQAEVDVEGAKLEILHQLGEVFPTLSR